MKQKIILATFIALTLTCQLVAAGSITDTYSTGDTLTATKMDNIKAAVNDNDTRITNNIQALVNTGLHNVTVLSPPACTSLASVPSGTYAKIGDMGTFSKVSPTSTVEVQFNGRLAALIINGTGVVFELRVDDTATANGRARSLVKASESGVDGIQSSITGIFTNLLSGTHTVSLWANGTNGTASSAFWDPGCWSSDHVVIKEIE